MVKKLMKLASLFKTKEAPKPHPWQFLPSCAHLKTVSFRATDDDDDKVNYVFFDPIQTPQFTWFTTSSSSESRSFSTESDLLGYCYDCDGESLEKLVRGVVGSSERLFFEPNGDTSSMLEKAKATNGAVSKIEESEFESQVEPKLTRKEKAEARGSWFNESSVLVAMDSDDPYEDFRRSMEEMVESHGVRDWEGLEELLSWYLMVNEKKNQRFILRAFVDLLFNLASSSSSNCSASITSYSSALSSLSKVQHEVEDEHVNILTS